MLERTFLGVDVGSYSIKVVEYQRGLREGRFTRCAEAQLPVKPSPDDVAAVLTHLLKEQGFSLDCPVTAIPGTRVTQRHFRLPFTGKQVPGAVRFEVEESVPVPIDRMILTHDGASVRAGETDVLAILTPRTEIEQHLALVRRAGVEPRHLEIEGAVLANFARFLELGDTPRIFLDIGHSKTQLCLVARNKPLLLRAIPIAGHHFTEAIAEELSLGYDDAEEHKHEHGLFKAASHTPSSLRVGVLLDQLVRESLRTLQALVSDSVNPTAPAEIVLVGGSAALPGLDQYFGERMGLPCRTLAVPNAVVGIGPLGDGRVHVFAHAAALALRSCGPTRSTQLELRQEEFRFVPDLSALWPQVQWTGLLLAVLLLLWPLSLGSELFGAHRQTSKLRGEIARVHQTLFPDLPVGEDPMQSFMARYQETKDLADHLGVTGSGASPLEILRRISSGIPEALNVTLSDLRIEQKSVRARGVAPDVAATNQIEQLLGQVEIFGKVTISDIQREQNNAAGGTPGYTFNLTIELGS
jgi:type IV pilus assembly protein PilM